MAGELADFWLPENEADIGDMRHEITKTLTSAGVKIEPAVIYDPGTPGDFLGISSGFVHTTAHGPLTKDIFFENLHEVAQRFCDLIAGNYDPFQPIRFYQPAQPAYGISPYTFAGDDAPFDLRVVGMAERSIAFENLDGEIVHAPGVKWFLCTMIVPDDVRDADVRRGVDWGAKYDR